MKSIFLMVIFFIAPILVYSQYLPQWAKYGMSESSIKMALGVDANGYVKDNRGIVKGVYLGRAKEVNNSLLYMEDPAGIITGIDKSLQSNDFEKLEKSLQSVNESILHYFVMDQANGLIAYMIYIEKNYEEVLIDFIRRYGKVDYYKDMFVWALPQNTLPPSTRGVSINFVQNNVRIIYYLH